VVIAAVEARLQHGTLIMQPAGNQFTAGSGFSRNNFTRRGLADSRLVIVRIRRDCFVIQEIGFVLGCTHTLESPGRLVQMEEASQISRSTAVGKSELPFWNPEVMLDEAQDAAEVIPEIADITCRRVGGDDNQRNAESILVVALGQRQNDWWLVIVPAAPIIPGDKDRSIAPINFTVGTRGLVANGIDNGCHPSRSTGIVGIPGVIGILPGRNNPAQRSEITVANVGQHIRRSEIHMV
jgi:hypothetical protein